jgi:transcription-repair coupling factor (superfamily II helicase)
MSIAEKLVEIIHNSPSVIRAYESLRSQRSIVIKGVAGSLKSLLLASFYKTFETQLLYLGSDAEEIEVINDDLAELIGHDRTNYFPAANRSRSGLLFSSAASKSARLSTLEALSESQAKIIVADVSTLLRQLPSSKKFVQQKISIRVNDSLEFEHFVNRVFQLGFIRESRVESFGEVSVRGGLVDIFPFSSEFPFRIEFWGDLVASVRKFDPATQRSLEEVNHVDLYPLSDGEDVTDGERSTILEFIKQNSMVVLDEPQLLRKHFQLAYVEQSRFVVEEPLLDNSTAADTEWTALERKIGEFYNVTFSAFGQNKQTTFLDLNARAQESHRGNFKLLKESFRRFTKDNSDGETESPTIFFLCENRSQAVRLTDIFVEEEMLFPNVNVAALGLHSGFVLPEAKLAVYTDLQFYGRRSRLRLPRKSHQGLTPKQLKYLNVGDFVVHVDYGIGQFRGLKKVTVRGHERECLHLEYRDGDNLYVRFERMDRVHKYSSKEGLTPALSKLGSADWQRLKNRTKNRIKDIAQELIDLYAKRKALSGFAHSEDSLWQRELEASFLYEDTPDQIKATLEVKKDLESAKPMDRLVCGDVGFGKTEVAIRAAFKSVLSGKQVAMLVPTTVLAYQHYNTFRERMEQFPVRIEMLSRFRSKTEQKGIVSKLKNGEIDIAIGTHRLLSKDVAFKDLGLLIIDEEQRFGVQHKERLKKFKTNVDVLTLTATPIPRTLHLALIGARDISNIDTPPKNRLPIATEIISFNKAYIREAILKELDRSGQIFFVHNRIRTIERVAAMLSQLVPEARVVVAHGQMPEDELEEVMVDFMQRKYQILVSTMIIESGLDIPNVNTIIVNRADQFGLAQLYQLRGRVGRSHQRAHAYLIVPPLESLNDEALKRLRAIQEFSELGSGSQLALRDLEIRGAGNLLGAEQSGFIDQLGFDLYNKILEEAVRELKDETVSDERPDFETQVDVDLDAFIPEAYIEAASERVDIYRRLMETTLLEQIEDIRSEVQDRFGTPPDEVDNLLNIMVIKLIGKCLGLSFVRIDERQALLEFAPNLLIAGGEPFKKWLGSIVQNATRPIEFIQNESLGIRIHLDSETANRVSIVTEFLQSIPNLRQV